MTMRCTTVAALLMLGSGARVKMEAGDKASASALSAVNASNPHQEKLTIEMKDAENVEDDVTVFPNADIAQGMMKPDKSFPKALQHIIWMDQAGQYASSTGVPAYGALPDGLVLLAQQGSSVDENGWQRINPCTGGWSWFWTPDGQANYKAARAVKGHCTNWVEWKDKERTHARFYGMTNPDPESFIEKRVTKIGATLMPWWNCKLNGLQCEEAAKVQCPPTEETPKSERYKCAMWERWNYVGFVPIGTYYAFAVVDPDGQPVEPYYTAFQEAMKVNNYKPTEQFVGTNPHPDWD